MDEAQREKNRIKMQKYRARRRARELALTEEQARAETEQARYSPVVERMEEEHADDEGYEDDYEEDGYEDDEEDYKDDLEDDELPIRNVAYSSPPSGHNWGLIALVAVLLLTVAVVSFLAGRMSTTWQLRAANITSQREVLDEEQV